MPALLGLWAPCPDHAERSLVVELALIASCFRGSESPIGVRTSAGQATQPPSAASVVAKGKTPFSGNATHSWNIQPTIFVAKY